MGRLFDLSADFAELLDRFDEIEETEFPTNADGEPVDADGKPVNPDFVKAELRQAWFDTLDGMEQEFTLKAENLAQYIKSLKAEADAIDAEAKRLQQRAKSRKNRIAWMKQYLMQCMETMQLKKVDGVQARITLRSNAPSVKVTDELSLIQELERTGHADALKYQLPEIRKNQLKGYLKVGEVFQYAQLEPSKSIIIA